MDTTLPDGRAVRKVTVLKREQNQFSIAGHYLQDARNPGEYICYATVVASQRVQTPSVRMKSENPLRSARTVLSNRPSACSCSGDVSPLASAQ